VPFVVKYILTNETAPGGVDPITAKIFNNRMKPPCTGAHNKDMKKHGGSPEVSGQAMPISRSGSNNILIFNNIISICTHETPMHYRSQKSMKKTWGFHQNALINNNITQLFSDENQYPI